MTPRATLTDAEIAEAAERLHLPAVCIRARLRLGWSAHAAAYTPVPEARRPGYARRAWIWLNRTGLLPGLKAEGGER